MLNTNEHISSYIRPYKYIKGFIGKLYSYSTKCEKNTVVSIHIYGARAIFMLFWYHQDIKSD